MPNHAGNIMILQVGLYLPTSEYDNSELDEIYDLIEDVININSKGSDYIIAMGDFNAIVGKKPDGKEVSCCGLGNQNERREKLVHFCKNNKLFITNPWFKHDKRQRYTWKKPGDTSIYQIDNTLEMQRYSNSVKNSCCYPGAEANTDHNMVMMKVKLRLKKIHGAKKVQRWNVEKLK